MNKKDFILAILEKIGDARPLGKILLTLGKNGELNDDMIDKLTELMRNSLNGVKDLKEKERIEKGIEVLNKLREKEKEYSLGDNERISEIEDLIDNI